MIGAGCGQNRQGPEKLCIFISRIMYKVVSYQVADSIDIKSVKSSFKSQLCYSDSSELFYETGAQQYVYIFKYGVVGFFNYELPAMSSFIQFIGSHSRNLFAETMHDEMLVQTGATENKISHNKVEIVNADREALRMIMLNVSQSVALDYYSVQTDKLIEETNHHTQLLEKKGRLDISGHNLRKFIGKTLLLKNRITENLYIFDSPPETWEDEQLDKLHNGLIKNFELQERFRNVSDGLGIVRENLELFKDLLQSRNSTVLEWIIIALIAVEVINFLIEKLF